MLALGVAIVFVLAVSGRVRLEDGNDLVLPLAVVAILSAVAPAASATLSDLIGWALPVGGVLLVGLVVATYSRLELGVSAPLTWVTTGLAVALGLVLQAPLTAALHPPPTTPAG